MSCKRTDISPDIQVWLCRISDEIFETYGLMSAEQYHQDWLEHEQACDITREQELADQFVEGLDICPDWPFYADDLTIVQEPQVFGP